MLISYSNSLHIRKYWNLRLSMEPGSGHNVKGAELGTAMRYALERSFIEVVFGKKRLFGGVGCLSPFLKCACGDLNVFLIGLEPVLGVQV
jgi:hypothetical protein